MTFDSTVTTQQSASDCRGVPVTRASGSAIDALEHAHESFLLFRGDPLAEVNEIIVQHPDFLLAYLFKAAYLTQILETRVHDDLIDTIAAGQILASGANERELGHLGALQAWADGRVFDAIAEWENTLARYPHDLLALQLVHLTYVLFGGIKGQRDVVARVFSHWDESIAGFESVLGFYAFGLEENGDFARAEQMAMLSLTLRADNPYAIHAVGHIRDMQGRPADGLDFMYEHIETWSRSDFSVHLWWHTALYHLELQHFDKVLEIYDDYLRGARDDMNRYEEFDATALLWRLKLLDIDIGQRWTDLAEKWEPSARDTLYAFNNIHAMMAFVAAAKTGAAQQLLSASEAHVDESSHDNVAAIREIGLPFCRAIDDFQQARYSACVDRLLPIRYKVDLIGGSYVQRDILAWTLLEAALRAGRHTLAAALASERCELKPTSPQHWLSLARAQDGAGQPDSAAAAEAKAQTLLSEAVATQIGT